MQQVGHAFQTQWELLRNILCLHLDENTIKFSHHASERMRERGIPESVAKLVMRRGEVKEMHAPMSYPHGEQPFENRSPVFTIVGYSEPETEPMAIALALDQVKGRARFTVVTVITNVEHNRYRP